MAKAPYPGFFGVFHENGHTYMIGIDGIVTDMSLSASPSGGSAIQSLYAPIYGHFVDHFDSYQFDMQTFNNGLLSTTAWTAEWTDITKVTDISPFGYNTTLSATFGKAWGINVHTQDLDFNLNGYEQKTTVDQIAKYAGSDSAFEFKSHEQISDESDSQSFATNGYVSATGHSEHHDDAVQQSVVHDYKWGDSFNFKMSSDNSESNWSHVQIGSTTIDNNNSSDIASSLTQWSNPFGYGSDTSQHFDAHDFSKVLTSQTLSIETHDLVVNVEHHQDVFMLS